MSQSINRGMMLWSGVSAVQSCVTFVLKTEKVRSLKLLLCHVCLFTCKQSAPSLTCIYRPLVEVFVVLVRLQRWWDVNPPHTFRHTPQQPRQKNIYSGYLHQSRCVIWARPLARAQIHSRKISLSKKRVLNTAPHQAHMIFIHETETTGCGFIFPVCQFSVATETLICLECAQPESRFLNLRLFPNAWLRLLSMSAFREVLAGRIKENTSVWMCGGFH